MPPISRGFFGRRADVDPGRLPPGQYLTRDFPVLSAGPTPKVHLQRWTLAIEGEIDEPRSWTWEELQALPAEEFTVDIERPRRIDSPEESSLAATITDCLREEVRRHA